MMTLSMHWYDWAGLISVALTLLAFLLLQAGRIRGDGLGYQLMNAVGAVAVLLSLLYAFNLSAFVLEALWLGISIYGIVRARRVRLGR
jgi:hypothetical protein